MGEKFERHKQAWTSDEVQKLHTLAKKGMPLGAIAKALTRSEESVKARRRKTNWALSACGNRTVARRRASRYFWLQ